MFPAEVSIYHRDPLKLKSELYDAENVQVYGTFEAPFLSVVYNNSKIISKTRFNKIPMIIRWVVPVNVRGGQVSDREESESQVPRLAALAVSELSAALQ